MTKIGKNIKKLRSVKGLSQQAFGELFNLTRGNISSYEERRAEPKIETIVSIAKYFGISLADIVTKELSVNELLNYDTNLVVGVEELKRKDKFADIPYVSSLNMEDYIAKFNDESYLQELPKINVPNSSKFRLIAFEADSSHSMPVGFQYKNGDVLIFKSVEKENIHLIIDKFGLMIDKEGLKYGIFTNEENRISLVLNEWISYPFDLESGEIQYWVLKATYLQVD